MIMSKTVWTANETVITLFEEPDINSALASQIVYGEKVEILEYKNDWVLVSVLPDKYQGYAPMKFFQKNEIVSNARVSNQFAAVYYEARSGSKIIDILSYSSEVVSKPLIDKPYFEIKFKGISKAFVHNDNLSNEVAKSTISEAKKLLGTPYQLGGRSSSSIDCSGLVQLTYKAYGITLPRDTKDQVLAGKDATKPYQDGDCIFWKGHVAMIFDQDQVIHANGHHMKVAIEPLNTAIERIKRETGMDPIAYRRYAN